MVIIIKIIGCSFLLACILRDFFHFQIDNRLIIGITVTGLLYQGLEYTPATWAWTLFIVGSLFVIGWGLFCVGIMGGGDGKLLAALGFWIPEAELWGFLMLTTFLGATVAIIELLGSSLLNRVRIHMGALGISPVTNRWRQPVPYGVAIALAGLCFLCGGYN